MVEEWRPVIGAYAQFYEVSSLARVRRSVTAPRKKCSRRGRIVKQRLNPEGYPEVWLWNRPTRKRYFVHRLVLEAFVGPWQSGYEADHLNFNRTDNRVENLRWLPWRENRSRRSGRDKRRDTWTRFFTHVLPPIAQRQLRREAEQHFLMSRHCAGLVEHR